MKNYILGFISALILVALAYGGYRLYPGLQRAKVLNELESPCAILNPSAGEFGQVRVALSAGSTPIQGVEVDLARIPGAEDYCDAQTGPDGVAVFERVPIGQYNIYFNAGNFPRQYGEPNLVMPVTVRSNGIAQVGIDFNQ